MLGPDTGADPRLYEVSPQVSSRWQWDYFLLEARPLVTTTIWPVPNYTAWWRGTCVWTTCSGLHIKHTTSWSWSNTLTITKENLLKTFICQKQTENSDKKHRKNMQYTRNVVFLLIIILYVVESCRVVWRWPVNLCNQSKRPDLDSNVRG